MKWGRKKQIQGEGEEEVNEMMRKRCEMKTEGEEELR